jgi:DNA-3-methyladenine glycosylase II
MATSGSAGEAGVGGAGWLEQARSQLRQADPVLARLIAEQPDLDPRRWLDKLPPMDLFGALLFQIVGQQLSIAATRHIRERIELRFGGRLPSAAEVLDTDPAQFRVAGLSWRKIGTLREIARRLSDGRLDPKTLPALAGDELIAAPTEIPGIGPWAAQDALIVALGREDEVLPGDLALPRPFAPLTAWITCLRSRRSWRLPRNGGLTAAWQPPICSRLPTRKLCTPTDRPRKRRDVEISGGTG